MSSPLAGVTALVAGATRGAGRAIAVELARAGAFVDGSKPDCWGQMAAEAAGGPASIEQFR